MGFRLNFIFITNQESITDEELLQKLGYDDKEKWSSTDFYGTNKQWDSFFVGSKNNIKIVSNGNLAQQAFQKNSRFLNFKESEIASIIWNETSGVYGFTLIKNGEILRSVTSIDSEEIEDGIGVPIKEEIDIDKSTLFESDEIEEIIEYEGEEYFKNLVKSEIICRAANNLAKRYIGSGLVELREHIEMIEYH